jgi:hypothetical protein
MNAVELDEAFWLVKRKGFTTLVRAKDDPQVAAYMRETSSSASEVLAVFLTTSLDGVELSAIVCKASLDCVRSASSFLATSLDGRAMSRILGLTSVDGHRSSGFRADTPRSHAYALDPR